MLAGAAGGAVAAVTTGGPDYAGIALLISACSAAIGTIGGLVIAFRRKSSASETVELIQQLRELEHPEAPRATP